MFKFEGRNLRVATAYEARILIMNYDFEHPDGATANTCPDRRGEQPSKIHLGSRVRVVPRAGGGPGHASGLQHPVTRFPSFFHPPTQHLQKSCSLISIVLQSCRSALLTLGRSSRDSGFSLSDEPTLEKPHSYREFARRPNPQSFAIGMVKG